MELRRENGYEDPGRYAPYASRIRRMDACLTLSTAGPRFSIMRKLPFGALMAIALLGLAPTFVSCHSTTEAPAQAAKAASQPQEPQQRQQPAQSPIPSPDLFPVEIAWDGGGINWASFRVRVKNTTGQDVYVKSLELRGVQGKNCELFPRYPELVPPHPFVRANDSRSLISDMRFNGVTERELTLCEVRAIAAIVMSPTYPGPESPQTFVVSESRALGN